MGFRHLFVALGAAGVLAGLGGCASAGSSSAHGSADVLTAEEMDSWGAQDLLEVIQRLRPRWLMARRGVNFSERLPVSVVVDGMRQDGSVEVLRRFRAGDVAEVRFLNAGDATTLYGLGMMSGAIVVTLKRGLP